MRVSERRSPEVLKRKQQWKRKRSGLLRGNVSNVECAHMRQMLQRFERASGERCGRTRARMIGLLFMRCLRVLAARQERHPEDPEPYQENQLQSTSTRR